MKSPPLLNPHHQHHASGPTPATTSSNHNKLHDVISSQTPPNSPLPNSMSSNNPQASSLLLFNKHQLNNYNFHEYFDKLNAVAAAAAAATSNGSKLTHVGHLNGGGGGGGGGGGKKREHTPNQSTDEMQLQLNSYLNPSYEDFNNGSGGGGGGRFRGSNSPGIMDAQKRQKLIKFSNNGLETTSTPTTTSTTPTTNNKTSQQKQLQSALHFTSEIEKELSNLTLSIEKDLERQQLHQQMSSEYYGNCARCTKPVVGRSEACQAMNQIYHGSCFVCMSCGRSLRAKPFYYLNNQVYCEEDYLYSGFLENAEKCDSCGHVIADMILQAMGKSYHPGCFRCFSCNECLDGMPFTLDINNRIYCIKDYYKIYAPKCAACGLSITPVEGTSETIRIVAMEKDFHVECYVCEKCGVQLGDESERRCFPLGKSLMCHTCHVKQVEMSQLDPFMSSFTNVKASRNNDFIYSPNVVVSSNGAAAVQLNGNGSSVSTTNSNVAIKKNNIQTENL